MTWPTGNIDASKFDADSDSISASRPELYNMAVAVNDMINTGGASFDGNLTGNLTTGNFVIQQTSSAGGQVTFADGINFGTNSITGRSAIFEVVELNAASPGEQNALTIDVDNAVAIEMSGTGSERCFHITAMAKVGASTRTLAGYLEIAVDGNVVYLPYYS